MSVDTSRWRSLGATANTSYFEIEPGVLAAVPTQGSVDDAPNAKENVAFQNRCLEQQWGGGVVVVFFDQLGGQTKDARRIYQSDPDVRFFRGSALVGGSLLGRAIASFFLGLSKPRVPVKMFATTDEALPWARSLNQAATQATTTSP